VKMIGLALFGSALVLTGYGIWLIATEVVQGARHEAGGIFLAGAAMRRFSRP
jgi:hypothetical protein